MAHLAAARRAASPLLLADATITPLAAVTLSLSAATQHSFRSSTAEISAAATPLLLTGATTTTTDAPLLLAATSTSTTTRVFSPAFRRQAAAKIVGNIPRPAAALIPISSPATLHRRDTRCFFSTLLGNRNYVSTPAYLATAGSRLARRGMTTDTTEALSPEVRRVLQRMEEESAARHDKFMQEVNAFELEIMSIYSAARLSSAETALTAGKVTWRVSTAVLAFGVTTLVAVLQTIKDGWKIDFQAEVKRMLDEMIDKLKAEILVQLRQLVRKELEVIEAEKAASKK